MGEFFFFQNLDTIGVDDDVLCRRKEGGYQCPNREKAHLARLRVAGAELPDRHKQQCLNEEQPAAALAEYLGKHWQVQLIHQWRPQEFDRVGNAQCHGKTDGRGVDADLRQPECHCRHQQRQRKAARNA